MKNLIDGNRVVRLYHYSSEERDIIKSMFRQSEIDKETLKQEDKKADIRKTRNYLKHISFFPAAIPRNMASLLGPKFTKWPKGLVLYEHVVEVSYTNLEFFDFVATKIETDFINKNFKVDQWSDSEFRKKFFEKLFKVKSDKGLIGSDVSDLYYKVQEEGSKLEESIINSKDEDYSPEDYEKYAAFIPHVLVWLKDAQVEPVSVKRIVIT